MRRRTGVDGPLAGQGPSVDGPEHDRAVFLQVFVAVEAQSFELPVALPSSFGRASVVESAAHRSVVVTHTHDPPFLRSRSTRAPPSVLA